MPVSYEVDEKIPIEQRQILGKLLETFYSKYPDYVQATDTKIKFAPTVRPDLKGAFNPENERLTVFQDKSKVPIDVLSTILHELTHAQQQKLGNISPPSPAIKSAIKKASVLGFSQDSPDEFLAQAKTVRDLQRAGPSKYLSTLEQLKVETPELEDYIQKNSLFK